MPWNILIFPLIGGFLIVYYSEFFKYYHQRVDRQVLIFNSVVAGITLIIISFIGVLIFSKFYPDLARELESLSPNNTEFFWTSFLTFILGACFLLLNTIINHEKFLKRAIRLHGNELERLLLKCEDDNGLIMISLRNGKVYIGWLDTLNRPSKNEFVRILPVISGYRDPISHKINYTTEYIKVFEDYISELKIEHPKDLEMSLVISESDIVSATNFEIEINEKFQSQ